MNDAGFDRSSADFAKVGRGGEVCGRIAKVHVVRHVEDFGTELGANAFREVGGLQQAEIDDLLARAKEHVTGGVAEGKRSGHREGGGVEIAFDALVGGVEVGADDVGAVGIPASLVGIEGDAEGVAGAELHDGGYGPSADDFANESAGGGEALTGSEGQVVGDGGVGDVAADGIAVATVECGIIRVLRSADDGDIVERLGPGVVGLEVKTALEASDEFELPLMGEGVAVGVEGQDARPGLERPTGLDSARGLRGGQVPFVVVPGDARGLVTQVRYPEAEIGAEFALDREIPLLRQGVPNLAIDGGEVRVGGDSTLTGERYGKGKRRLVDSALIGLGELEGSVGARDLPDADVDRDHVVEHAEAATDDGAAVVERTIREAETGSEVVVIGPDDVRSPTIGFRAYDGVGLEEAGQREGGEFAAFAANDEDAFGEIEVGKGTIAFLGLRLEHVAHADVDGELLAHLPVVLEVSSVAGVVKQVDQRRGAADGGDGKAEQEVSVGIIAIAAVEGERTELGSADSGV